jgi:hypothetical protein
MPPLIAGYGLRVTGCGLRVASYEFQVSSFYFRSDHSWPFEPLRCMKMTRRSPDERLRTAADCLRRLGVLGRTQCRYRVKDTTLGINPNPLFKDGPGSGLEPVGGEFQPSFETGYTGGGAHLIRLRPLSPLSLLCRLCSARDVTQILFSF